MKRLSTWLAVVLIALTASAARAADVPSTVNLQAFLQTSGGAPLTGTYSLAVRLYTSSGATTAAWAETLPSVTAAGGMIDITLGAGTPLPAAFFAANGDVWLGVSVDGQPELPRTPLRSVAYAFRARSALSAEQSGDLACSGCVAIGELAFDPATQAELDTHAANAGAHHTRYANSEAIAAMGAKTNTNPLHHDRFTSAEALTTMGAKGNTNPLHHDRYTNAEAVTAMGAKANTNALHHDRYTDAQAIAANTPYTTSVDGKTGGTISGNVAVTGTLSAGGKAVCTAAGNCPDKDALGALSCGSSQIPKWNGTAWACAADGGGTAPPVCTGPGKALQWDGSEFTCVNVSTGGNSQANGFALIDSWGYAWDGLERPATTWSNAKSICVANGGRLPTATELYRVSWVGTGEVGSTYTTAWLWGLIEEYASTHIVGRLDNGDISYSADSSPRAFRCVWTNNTATTFTGNHCYGPPGSECWAKKGEGDRYHMDKYDRPLTSYNVAVRECAHYGAHLSSERDLTEEIRRGLPNGTNAWLITSDAQSYNGSGFLAGLVRWSGTNTAFDDSYSTYATWGYKGAGHEHRFRCVGVNYGASPHPNAVANQFVNPSTSLKSHTNDLGPAALHTATSACWAGGGHLPSTRDLHELIMDGLPNGSNNWLWTSDQEGYNGTQFLVGISRWSGTDKSFSDYYSTYATWGYKTDSQRYRCVYYPLDTAYAGPSSCNGGCFASTKKGNVKMWMDQTDRPANRFHIAVSTCNGLGGHLATERDFVEIVREGLPNGSNAWLWTSDQQGYNGSNFLVGITRWSGTNTGYTGQYSAYSTWGYKVNSSSYNQPYRCVWTNELR